MLAHMEKIYEQISNRIKVIEAYQSPDNKRGFKYEVQHGLEIHKTPDAGF